MALDETLNQLKQDRTRRGISMSIEENKALIRRYIAAMSGKPKSEALLEEYISDEGLRRHILIFEAAFPRYELAIEGLVAEGDHVALRPWGAGADARDRALLD